LSNLGDCYAAQGLDTLALHNYQEAISTMEKIRSRLDVEAHKTSYSAGIQNTYQSAVLTCLRLNNLSEAFEYTERSRARSFLDLLASDKIWVGKSQHEDFFATEQDFCRKEKLLKDQIYSAADDTQNTAQLRGQLKKEAEAHAKMITEMKYAEPEISSMVSVNSLTLSEVQDLIDPKSTLLEYFLTQENMVTWVISKDQTEVFQTPIPSDSLKNLVNGFRQSIEFVGEEPLLAKELYRILIEPVLEKIKTEHLVIVPHGILHYLPFQALQNQEGEYLLDRFCISYLPSASALKYILPKRRPKGQKLLALGNPSTNVEGFAPLPYCEEEVRSIAELYQDKLVLTQSTATEDKFVLLASQYDILHLACHADLNSAYPMFSGLLLAPGEAQDGDLNVYEIFSLDLSAYLVILSACQTGLGHLTNGDELVGLARAFVYAGTPSILSSLWMVDDESTAYFMKQFHQNLRTYDKAKSLQRAQQQTREKFSDPRAWAAFVLIGDTF
ncbi:MAG: CHAT domain-containing protein, partial [bacterium]